MAAIANVLGEGPGGKEGRQMAKHTGPVYHAHRQE